MNFWDKPPEYVEHEPQALSYSEICTKVKNMNKEFKSLEALEMNAKSIPKDDLDLFANYAEKYEVSKSEFELTKQIIESDRLTPPSVGTENVVTFRYNKYDPFTFYKRNLERLFKLKSELSTYLLEMTFLLEDCMPTDEEDF